GFDHVNGMPRGALAAIDAVSGHLAAWRPRTPLYRGRPTSVNAIAVGGGVVYVGGFFKQIGRLPRVGVAAIDTAGRTTPWTPGPLWLAGGSEEVDTLAVAGSDVYVAGAFERIGGVARRGVAKLDARTGRVRAWDPELDR